MATTHVWANGPLYAAHLDDELIMIGTSRRAVESGLSDPKVMGKVAGAPSLMRAMIREITPALAHLINKSGMVGRRIKVLADRRLGTYEEWRREHRRIESSNGLDHNPAAIHVRDGA